MKKRRHINCTRCSGIASWYKKGKGHRVLVCANCGIIASNPIPLLALAAAAPSIIKGVRSFISKDEGQEAPPSPTQPRPPSLRTSRNTFTAEERVALALR